MSGEFWPWHTDIDVSPLHDGNNKVLHMNSYRPCLTLHYIGRYVNVNVLVGTMLYMCVALA